METAITALILIGLLVLAVLGLAEQSMTAQAALLEASRLAQERMDDRVRTDLTAVSATTSALGDYVYVTLKNTGTTKLAAFDQWDVILQYSDGAQTRSAWVPRGAAVNQWTQQIYQTTTPLSGEVFEPDILNPGEEIVIRVNVLPWVAAGSTNVAAVAAPNGIAATSVFTK